MNAGVLVSGIVTLVAAGCGSFGAANPGTASDAAPSADDGGLARDDARPPDACGDRSGEPRFTARFEDGRASPFGFENRHDPSSEGTQDFTVVANESSSDNALRVRIDGAGISHTAWLRRGFPVDVVSTKRIRLDFDVVLEDLGHRYVVVGAIVFWGPEDDNRSIALAARQGYVLDEANDVAASTPFFDGVQGKRHHATICAFPAADTGAVRRLVLVDGAIVDDRSAPVPTTTGFDVRIGLFYTSVQDVETRVRYDDIELRVD